jgi:hypothetical protein
VRYEPSESCVNFKAYEIVGWGYSGEYLFQDADCHFANSPDKAQTLITGAVKWDGCSHYYFGEAENSGYIHLCGAENILHIGEAILRIYNRSGELMRERGTDEIPDLINVYFPAVRK